MKKMVIATLLSIFGLLGIEGILNQTVLASTVHSFSSEFKLGPKTLVLNGKGLRLATFLKIKAYEAALYLEKKSNNPEMILKSSEQKGLQLFFLRDIDQSKIEESFKEGVEKNFTGKSSTLLSKIEEIAQYFGNGKEGTTYTIIFHNKDKVEITSSAKKDSKIFEMPDISEGLLSIWLGKNPPNEELKNGLLSL